MIELEKIAIRRPDDFHVHFRQDEILKHVVPHTARQFARALVMPNTLPPIVSAQNITNYRTEIELAATGWQFEPLMTFKLLPTTTPTLVRDAYKAGAIAGKLYPEGVTTHSQDGIRNIHDIYPALDEMEDCGLVLSIHGELPGAFCLEREQEFLPLVSMIADRFPGLRIVLEHLSSSKAVEFIQWLPNTVAATITVHHLLLTLDDVIGDKLRPHHFCKPVAKWPSDREKLIEAATSGNPKFFLGTDSAPHPQSDKECSHCAAGIFSAPVALPLLVQIFEQQGALDRLESFTSTFGAAFYDLPLNEGSIELVKESLQVPGAYLSKGGICVIPFMAGETLNWQLTPT